MKELQSGMMLMTNFGDLNFLAQTHKGFIVIDSCGSIIPFEKELYKYAFTPVSYDDTWEEVKGSQIVFKEEL